MHRDILVFFTTLLIIGIQEVVAQDAPKISIKKTAEVIKIDGETGGYTVKLNDKGVGLYSGAEEGLPEFRLIGGNLVQCLFVDRQLPDEVKDQGRVFRRTPPDIYCSHIRVSWIDVACAQGGVGSEGEVHAIV